MKKLWDDKNSQIGQVFHGLVKSLFDFLSEDKDTMMIEHFLFLILTEQ